MSPFHRSVHYAQDFGTHHREKAQAVRASPTGFYFCGATSPLYECFILDISEGGARIEVGELIPPKAFVLLLTPTGSVSRHCVTAWRRGAEIGVRFHRPRRPVNTPAALSDAPAPVKQVVLQA